MVDCGGFDGSKSSVYENYLHKIESCSSELAQLKARFAYMYIARLLSFVGFVVLLVVYFNGQGNLVLAGSLFLLVLFCVLIKLDAKHLAKKKYLKAKLAVNQVEVKIMQGDFADRQTGEDYKSIDPFLTNDFDIVGLGSLFQFLNRSVTKLGERLFVENLSSGG